MVLYNGYVELLMNGNRKMSKTMKGFFTPLHPEKYHGNVHNIVYRSSYELSCMRHFDSNPNVLQWQSEERSIIYRSPIDLSLHRYFPDFIIKVKTKDGTTKTIMIEVKPFSQTVQPSKGTKKKTKTYLRESIVYATNTAKWDAAKAFCKKKGWEFKILTEKQIFRTNYLGSI